MIQPLRAAHRRAFVGLAVVLPSILLIGIGARSSRPDAGALIADVPANANVLKQSNNLWEKHTIQSTFYSRADRPQQIYVVLQSPQNLSSPDLLLYWVANAPQGDVLPEEARLVGALETGKALFLPLNEARAGYLVLFSPAHQSVFDTAKVEKLP